MINLEAFRFTFKVGGNTFGLTQDTKLVDDAIKAGCNVRPYPRLEYSDPMGSTEWEVNLGVRPEEAATA